MSNYIPGDAAKPIGEVFIDWQATYVVISPGKAMEIAGVGALVGAPDAWYVKELYPGMNDILFASVKEHLDSKHWSPADIGNWGRLFFVVNSFLYRYGFDIVEGEATSNLTEPYVTTDHDWYKVTLTVHDKVTHQVFFIAVSDNDVEMTVGTVDGNRTAPNYSAYNEARASGLLDMLR